MTGSTLPNVEAFCRTFETGSFSSAARVLEVTPQATSRSVARLEKALGVTLFRRTTRSLAPTDAARRYYELCQRALLLLATGEKEISAQGTAPSGLVRISAPSTYGLHRLVPALGAFRDQHPRVRVDVSIASRNIDFVREGYDLAIRMGVTKQQTMVVRKLGDFPLGVFASNGYLSTYGAPTTPDDLANHACIAFVMPSSGRVLPWTFMAAGHASADASANAESASRANGNALAGTTRASEPRGRASRTTELELDSAYRCSDDPLGAIALARAGVGLVQTYDFLVEDDLARGSLTEVLTKYRGASRPFSLIYPSNVRLSRAARALVDFVVRDAANRAG
ncbi:MAG: LysR substrate-binding domain-containing protein [Kofleriaceae bacterium]